MAKLSEVADSGKVMDVLQAAIELLPGGSAAVQTALAAWVAPTK
jgi:hypothetical protein